MVINISVQYNGGFLALYCRTKVTTIGEPG